MPGGIYILMLEFGFYFHRFTLADMKNGVVIYEHDGGVNFQDSFKFTVKVENIPLEGNVKIRILSESHTDPPHIINNNVITVDENSVTAITEEDLEVCVVIISSKMRQLNTLHRNLQSSESLHIECVVFQVSHPETRPVEIQYTITHHPQYGMLMIRDGLDGENLRMFTQADVDQGLLM